jgi:Ca-activated chloride channel homolog
MNSFFRRHLRLFQFPAVSGAIFAFLIVLGGCDGDGRNLNSRPSTNSTRSPGVRRWAPAQNDDYQKVMQEAQQQQSSISSDTSDFELQTEAYDATVENDFVAALSNPLSTFSIDVDTASYSNVRRMIHQGQVPPSGAVRIEEFVNYFRYDYPEPEGKYPFSVATEVAQCPWNEDHQLVRIGLKAKSLKDTKRPQCNLVFLIDVSGSMHSENKLPLVKAALQSLVERLKKEDRIAIVVYAGDSGMALESTPVKNSSKIRSAIEKLQASGSTNGGAGIQLAYEIAQSNFIERGVNRVILCTDGDFNVGTTSQSALVDLITKKRASQVYLTVLGVGDGNLNDSLMEKLADKGNGNYAYIDGLSEARKVLTEQAASTLVTIAKDVKIQVDFNPRHVRSYRLIGYENRSLANQDFRDDTKDAGEIGAGHTVTAFYEIVPSDYDGDLREDRGSEFVKASIKSESDSKTLLTVNLRYLQPDEDSASEFQVRVDARKRLSNPSSDFAFATSVIGYGMLLRQSKFAGSMNWHWVVQTAEENIGRDPQGLREEFVELCKQAAAIAPAQQ